MDHVKWHRRASMLYAMGTWTLLGYCFYSYKKKPSLPEETTSTKNSDEDTTIVEKRTTAFTETTVIQRAGTVEYHTRLLNPFGSRNDSPPENKTDDEELK